MPTSVALDRLVLWQIIVGMLDSFIPINDTNPHIGPNNNGKILENIEWWARESGYRVVDIDVERKLQFFKHNNGGQTLSTGQENRDYHSRNAMQCRNGVKSSQTMDTQEDIHTEKEEQNL